MARRVAPLIVLLLLALGRADSPPAAAQPATTPAAPLDSSTASTSVADDRIARWEQDLATLIAALERRHPNPYWRFTPEEFEDAIDDVRTRLDEWSDDRITIEVIRLAAMIDGHSGIYVGDLAGWDFAKVRFYLFEEGVGVVAVDDPALVGGRLVAIGDTPADEALDAVWTLANYDNEMTRKSFAMHFLAVPRLLAGLGIIPDHISVTYTTETASGELLKISPEIGTHRDYLDWFGPFVVGHVQSQRAMHLADRWNPFWWRYLDESTIYAQYNAVVGRANSPSGTGVTLRDFADDLAQAIDTELSPKVILDMRHNLGGNLFTYGPLLNMLVDRFSDSCGLHVIVGRDTFSAAMTFVVKLEQSTTATFYGERTGASPNLYGDTRTTLLPNSRLPFKVSSIYWETAGPDDDRLWLEPSIVIPVRLDDWRAGRDPALEAVLESDLCGR